MLNLLLDEVLLLLEGDGHLGDGVVFEYDDLNLESVGRERGVTRL